MSQHTVRMDECVDVVILRFDKEIPVRVTKDWQYIHKKDLENLLGLPRVDIRGKTTTKIKYLDSTKNRVVG